ncbi:MAG TPA: hypothetical protein VK524_32570 [Polyangiaceae bacterium]|nr:hypothetical protein [Polyangiaceae bacterium]
MVQAEPTSETVALFIKQLQLAGGLSSEQARLWRTAVRRFAKELRDDEPDRADWMLKNLDKLAARIASNDKLSTARTYRSRAEAGLKRFVAWRKNPVAFSVDLKNGDVNAGHASASKGLSVCPLGPNRVFEYRIPADGITRRDIERIATHLWTLANDYSDTPIRPAQLGLGLDEGDQ